MPSDLRSMQGHRGASVVGLQHGYAAKPQVHTNMVVGNGPCVEYGSDVVRLWMAMPPDLLTFWRFSSESREALPHNQG